MQTPYYIIHKDELDNNYQKLTEALDTYWRGNWIVGYSYKTNSLPWIAKEFDHKGCFAEVVSEEEYRLAHLIGVRKDKIVYNGPIKTRDTFVEALKNGDFVNIDSQREIDWLDDVSPLKCNLGIRVNFDLERFCPDQSQCGAEGGRFGFCYENDELYKAIQKIQSKGFEVKGLHLHVSSKSRGVDIYEAIAVIACEVKEKYGLNLSYVDIGGGFFGGMTGKPQFDEYLSAITRILSKSFNDAETTLILEPGMALIGSPISYITTVIDVKDTMFNRFVVTDGTRTNIDPLMRKRSYFHRYERSGSEKIIKKQVVCGYTCMESDRIYEAIEEEELSLGDRIIYDRVGAYTMCLTPLFIKYFPDVYVEENNHMTLVRKAWTPQEYVVNSLHWRE